LADGRVLLILEALESALDIARVARRERGEDRDRELLVDAPRMRQEPARPLASNESGGSHAFDGRCGTVTLGLADPSVLAGPAEDVRGAEDVARP